MHAVKYRAVSESGMCTCTRKTIWLILYSSTNFLHIKKLTHTHFFDAKVAPAQEVGDREMMGKKYGRSLTLSPRIQLAFLAA